LSVVERFASNTTEPPDLVHGFGIRFAISGLSVRPLVTPVRRQSVTQLRGPLPEEYTMLRIHTILHPTDFSQRSAYALHLACALARDYHAKLFLLHVVPQPIVAFGEGVIPPEPEFRIEEGWQRLNELVIPGTALGTTRKIAQGDPAAAILDEARSIAADLIVMGTHGRTGLPRLLMGSVAEQVSRRATCPVLTAAAPFLPTIDPGEPIEETMATTGAQ
jgi:nucleotide-binding universal stress UspA family protein